MNRVLFVSLAVLLLLRIPDSYAADPQEVAVGERLAALLRVGRSVISGHQALINDPAVGDKGIDGDRIVAEAIALYVERTGSPVLADDLSERERRLTEAQIEAMREVVDEHEAEIDAEGVGFKAFIPAVFGRLVNERFAEKVGSEAMVKVTAPHDLVRNRKARPDAWEAEVIETQFQSPDWPKGQAYTEAVEVGGRPAFRMLLPEYYSASCLSCHGSPEGEVDVTGYPKEGGSEGDLAGAISITLFE